MRRAGSIASSRRSGSYRDDGGSSSQGSTSTFSAATGQKAIENSLFGVLFTMRSNTEDQSTLLPIISIIIDFFQLLAFNLNPSFPWSPTVRLNIAQPISTIQLKFGDYLAGFDSFLVPFWIVFVFLIAAYADVAWVAYGFRTNRFRVAWPIKALSAFVSFLPSVLFLPFLNVFLVPLDCVYIGKSSPVMDQFPGQSCWDGTNGALSSVSIVMAVSLILFSFVVALVFVIPDPTSRHPLSSPHSRIEVLLLLSRTVLAVLATVINRYTLIIALANAFFTFLNFASMILYIPYFHKRINYLRCSLSAIIAFSSFTTLLVVFKSDPTTEAFTIMLFVGAPLAGLCGFSLCHFRYYATDARTLVIRQLKLEKRNLLENNNTSVSSSDYFGASSGIEHAPQHSGNTAVGGIGANQNQKVWGGAGRRGSIPDFSMAPISATTNGIGALGPLMSTTTPGSFSGSIQSTTTQFLSANHGTFWNYLKTGYDHLDMSGVLSSNFKLHVKFDRETDVELATRFLETSRDDLSLRLADSIFEAGLKQFNSAYLCVTYANFLTHRCKNPQLAEVFITKADKLRPGFALRFQIYAKQRQAQSERQYNTVGDGDLDLASYVDFKRHWAGAKRHHYETVVAIKTMWRTLLPKEPNAIQLPRIMEKIYRNEERADRHFAFLLKNYKFSSRVLRAYAMFLADVKNDRDSAQRYFAMADETDEEQTVMRLASANSTYDVSGGGGAQSAQETKNPRVEINHHAIVTSANAAACSFLGYSTSELIGHKLSDFVRNSCEHELLTSISSPDFQSVITLFVNKDGQDIPCHISDSEYLQAVRTSATHGQRSLTLDRVSQPATGSILLSSPRDSSSIPGGGGDDGVVVWCDELLSSYITSRSKYPLANVLGLFPTFPSDSLKSNPSQLHSLSLPGEHQPLTFWCHTVLDSPNMLYLSFLEPINSSSPGITKTNPLRDGSSGYGSTSSGSRRRRRRNHEMSLDKKKSSLQILHRNIAIALALVAISTLAAFVVNFVLNERVVQLVHLISDSGQMSVSSQIVVDDTQSIAQFIFNRQISEAHSYALDALHELHSFEDTFHSVYYSNAQSSRDDLKHYYLAPTIEVEIPYYGPNNQTLVRPLMTNMWELGRLFLYHAQTVATLPESSYSRLQDLDSYQFVMINGPYVIFQSFAHLKELFLGTALDYLTEIAVIQSVTQGISMGIVIALIFFLVRPSFKNVHKDRVRTFEVFLLLPKKGLEHLLERQYLIIEEIEQEERESNDGGDDTPGMATPGMATPGAATPGILEIDETIPYTNSTFFNQNHHNHARFAGEEGFHDQGVGEGHLMLGSLTPTFQGFTGVLDLHNMRNQQMQQLQQMQPTECEIKEYFEEEEEDGVNPEQHPTLSISRTSSGDLGEKVIKSAMKSPGRGRRSGFSSPEFPPLPPLPATSTEFQALAQLLSVPTQMRHVESVEVLADSQFPEGQDIREIHSPNLAEVENSTQCFSQNEDAFGKKVSFVEITPKRTAHFANAVASKLSLVNQSQIQQTPSHEMMKSHQHHHHVTIEFPPVVSKAQHQDSEPKQHQKVEELQPTKQPLDEKIDQPQKDSDQGNSTNQDRAVTAKNKPVFDEKTQQSMESPKIRKMKRKYMFIVAILITSLGMNILATDVMSVNVVELSKQLNDAASRASLMEHVRLQIREYTLRPSAYLARDVVDALNEMEMIHYSLLYGNATRGYKDVAIAYQPLEDLYYDHGCLLFDEASCPTPDNAHYLDLTQGFAGLFTHYENEVANFVQQEIGTLVFKDEQFDYIYHEAAPHVKDGSIRALELYLGLTLSRVKENESVQIGLSMLSICITMFLYLFIFRPIIKYMQMETTRTSAMIMMVPKNLLEEVKEVQQYIEQKEGELEMQNKDWES